jgi:hypothetical protein
VERQPAFNGVTGFSVQFSQMGVGITLDFSWFVIHIENFGKFEGKIEFFSNFLLTVFLI